MDKFRKRPVVIEAVRVADENLNELLSLAANDYEIEVLCRTIGESTVVTNQIHSVNIKTLEGTMRADPGDWIIKGVNGEFYPCKPDIFEKTYESVQ